MTVDLIGRDTEIRALADLLTPGREDGAAVVLTGEAGIGKSSVLDAAWEIGRAAGFRVLMTTGVEAETKLPHSGLHQLLRPLLDGVEDLPGPQRLALLSAFGAVEAGEPEPFLIGLATLNLLADTAAQRPVAILVDDAQWLDQPTHDTLAFLARRVAMDPIVLIGVVRSGHSGPLITAGLPEITLMPLTEAEADDLLSRHPDTLEAGMRQRILREAQGNPLALVELPKAGPGGATRGLPSDVLPVTSRLERSFAGRALQLRPSARDALLVAAVSGTDDVPEVVAATSVLTGAPMSIAVFDPITEAGLLTADESRLRFRHPLVRSAVLQVEPPHRRQSAHAALASAVNGNPFRRAWHHAHAIVGPDDTVADELADVVRYPLARGAVASAIRCLERSAQLTTDPSLRGHRLLVAAEHAFGLGRADVVDRLVHAAADLPLSTLDRARMQWLQEIFNDGVPGDADRVRDLCTVADQAQSEGDFDLALHLLLGAALRCWWADAGPAARAHVVRVLDAFPQEQTADPRFIAALVVAEPVLRAAEVLDRLSHVVIEDVSDADALRLYGMAAHAAGHSPLAADFLDRAETRLRTQGRLGLLSHVLAMLVGIRLNLGEWDRAAAAADEAMRLGGETGQSIWNAGGKVGQARMAALRSDRDEALALAAEVERAAGGKRLNNLLSCVQAARGMAWVRAGRYDEGYNELRRMFDPDDPAYHVRESYLGILFLAEAAIHSGRLDDARSVITEFDAVAAVTPSPDLHLNLAYARAVLATDDQAEALYRAALEHELVRWPWMRARLELAFGTWLRRQRRIGECRVYLRAALAGLSVMGATVWANQARAELRAAGERTGRSLPSAQELLTPQELQIAHMAGAGLSNREIGQQLYLSPRTIGSHLYRIFPKLDVTSRAQLAARLAELV